MIQSFLPCFILKEQSKSIVGRLITDGHTIDQEAIYLVEAKNDKGMLLLALLDLVKARNNVNWYFIHIVLLNFGFC